MIVALTGASGLVGSAVISKLEAAGHEVRRLVRRSARGPVEIEWDPERDSIDSEALAQVDALIHLAGESIAAGRWSKARKQRILDSRVLGTSLIARAIAGMERGPRVLLCASAIGFYGDRGEEELGEEATAGDEFLSRVCTRWEDAAAPAREAGLRVAHFRLGIVLSASGGALTSMLPPFRMGLGGILGNGRQWWSWIDVDDVAGAFLWALENESAQGIYNCVAPEPTRNRDFTKTLGRVLGRPTFLPAPAFALKLLLGEMAEPLLLGSTRAIPRRLNDEGYRFAHPDLENSLRRHLR